MAVTGNMDWAGVSLPGLGPETVALVTGGSGAIGGRVGAACWASGHGSG